MRDKRTKNSGCCGEIKRVGLIIPLNQMKGLLGKGGKQVGTNRRNKKHLFMVIE